MIEINNVSMHFPLPKRFREFCFRPFSKCGNFNALSNVNLDIKQGDRVGFLGVNGAGKTTLLKLVGGLIYPTIGNIRVNGYNTVSNNLKARKSVGYVLNEERSFYWRLSGLQNLEFFGVLDNLQGEYLQSKITELIELVGLEESKHKLVANYSSGMKQRLAIARGLLSDPQILILDEPTRTLDPDAVNDVKKLITNKIHEGEKRTLLIATHRFDEVEELCNKVCIMNNGKLLSYSSLDEIWSEHLNISEYYHTMINKNKMSII